MELNTSGYVTIKEKPEDLKDRMKNVDGEIKNKNAFRNESEEAIAAMKNTLKEQKHKGAGLGMAPRINDMDACSSLLFVRLE